VRCAYPSNLIRLRARMMTTSQIKSKLWLALYHHVLCQVCYYAVIYIMHTSGVLLNNS
jgi:hypothetical protein